MTLQTIFLSYRRLAISLVTLLFSLGAYAQKKTPVPCLNDAEQFVSFCLKTLKQKDSLSFKALFMPDTVSNVERDTRQVLQNKLIFANYHDLQQKLQTYLDTAANIMPGCNLFGLPYKDQQSKKKKVVYHVQAALQTNANTSVQLDLPCLFLQQKFSLISAIAINEIVQSNE
jgi:hypothetical protein